MRGARKGISAARRLIIDLMRASTGVPFVSLSRAIDVSAVVAARKRQVHPFGWAAIFAKAFCLAAKEQPTFRTLFLRWPWPRLFELENSVAVVAIARQWNGEDAVLPQKIRAPELQSLARVNARIKAARGFPIQSVPSFRNALRMTAYPALVRRLLWAICLNHGRQRGNWIGNVGITSVSAYGAGELEALSPGPFIFSYGRVEGCRINVIVRWDHRVTDGVNVAKFMTRMEELLNSEIADEICGVAES